MCGRARSSSARSPVIWTSTSISVAASASASAARKAAGKQALKKLLAERKTIVDARKAKNREDEQATEQRMLDALQGMDSSAGAGGAAAAAAAAAGAAYLSGEALQAAFFSSTRGVAAMKAQGALLVPAAGAEKVAFATRFTVPFGAQLGVYGQAIEVNPPGLPYKPMDVRLTAPRCALLLRPQLRP
jgi:hypothetical protein